MYQLPPKVPSSVKAYVALCTFFAIAFVTGNLIFRKFVEVNLGWCKPELSVGVFLYPLTFVVTDLIAECYGKSYADFCVKLSISMSLIVMSLISFADALPASTWSMLNDQEFHKMFSMYEIGFFASIMANLTSQLIDIRIYLLLKRLTKDKHLWLRNNASTIFSQLIDTIIVTGIMIGVGVVPLDKASRIILSTVTFKALFSIFYTPLFYLGVYTLKRMILNK
jgi:uncharacterized integral membrane protein (TIGR00697 family)